MTGVLICASACTSLSEIENVTENITYEELTISACQECDSQTKTVLQDNGSVWWKPGDAIGVFFGNHCYEFYSCNLTDAPVADFVGKAVVIQGGNENASGTPAQNTYWGVFPPNLTNVYTQDRNYDYKRGNSDYQSPTREGESINVYLPAYQKALAGTFDSNYFISIAKNNNYKELSFYNLCGGLAFCVKNEGITKVTFKGNAGEILAGQVSVVMNSEGRPVVNNVINGKTEVTLVMKNGEFFIPGEWYYMVMLPTVLDEGYTISFNGQDVVSTIPVKIQRSVFGRLTNPDADLGEISPTIITDGDFSDWDNIDPSLISEAVCDQDARYTALKSFKAFSDPSYLYLLVEFDEEQILDKSLTPFHVFLNIDNSSSTGGYEDMWNEAYIDYMLEGTIFIGDEYVTWDPYVFKWWGEVGGSGWEWCDPSLSPDYENNYGALVGEYSGVATSAGNANKFEIAINKFMIPDASFAETFKVGVEIEQGWCNVGNLPNTACTDDNLTGRSQMLTVVTY